MKELAIVSRTIIIHKDRFTYDLGPCITILDNGEWLVGFNHSRRRERILHPSGDPLYRTLLTRTSDLGRTWEEPYFAPDFDWSGVNNPGVTQLKNGNVVLIEVRCRFYPLELAKKKRAAGELISINLPGLMPGMNWTCDFKDDDWGRSKVNWAHGHHGLYAHLSTDRGHTFEKTIEIDRSPYHEGYNRANALELSDGRLAYPISGHYPPHDRYTYILFSSTGGQSWDPPILIADSPVPTFCEPDIAEVAPGEIYCILRTENPDGYLYGCRSLDGGKSWSVPEATPMFGLSNPGHLLVLQDGRLLCTYGRRTVPFGIRACLSEDGGRTWKIDQEIVIRNDLPNSDLGYPETIEYAPGRLFSCYYGQEPDGVTCVQGTHVTLT